MSHAYQATAKGKPKTAGIIAYGVFTGQLAEESSMAEIEQYVQKILGQQKGGRCSFDISWEMLAQQMQLPNGVAIEGINVDNVRATCQIILSDTARPHVETQCPELTNAEILALRARYQQEQ